MGSRSRQASCVIESLASCFLDDHLAGCSLLPSDWFRGADLVDNVPAYAFHDTGNNVSRKGMH